MSRAIVLLAAAGLGCLVLGFAAGRWLRGRECPAPSVSRATTPETPDSREEPSAIFRASGSAAAPAETGPERGEGAAEADPSAPEALEVEGTSTREWRALADALLAAAGERRDPFQDPVLRSRALVFRGKVATLVSDGRGELTHPAVAGRVIAEALSRSGHPLSPDQRRRAAELARRYEESFASLADPSSEATLRLERVLGEMELKEGFLEELRGLLTEAQRQALAGPDGDSLLPLLSPLVMADVERLKVESPEALRQGLLGELSRGFGLEPGFAEGIAGDLVQGLAPLLDPAAAGSIPELERVILAGRVQAQAFRRILAWPGLDPAVRERLLALDRWMVPER